MTTFGELKLQGVLNFSDGYRTKASELAACGYRILRAGDVRDGRPVFDSPDFVDERMLPAIGNKQVRERDVVLTTKGTVGRTAFVHCVPSPAVYSPQLCFFRTDSTRLDPRYLYYWFSGPQFRHQSFSLMSSTDMAPYMSLSQLEGIDIDIPEVREQQAIAEVLGALDDKIAANSSMVATSDRLMEALYAESASISGRLTDLARFVNGRNFTKEATGNGRVVVRIAELNSGIGGSTVRNQVDAPDVHLARPGDILFAWSGSLTLCRWTMSEALVNQHIFKVIPGMGVPSWVVYYALAHQMPMFKAIATDKATTMGHIQRKHLEVDVPIPARSRWGELDTLIAPLWDRSLSAAVESHTLAKLRDSLLPPLMDGTLRVKDAVAQVEEVL